VPTRETFQQVRVGRVNAELGAHLASERHVLHASAAEYAVGIGERGRRGGLDLNESRRSLRDERALVGEPVLFLRSERARLVPEQRQGGALGSQRVGVELVVGRFTRAGGAIERGADVELGGQRSAAALRIREIDRQELGHELCFVFARGQRPSRRRFELGKAPERRSVHSEIGIGDDEASGAGAVPLRSELASR
jgi:hypothetical protein